MLPKNGLKIFPSTLFLILLVAILSGVFLAPEIPFSFSIYLWIALALCSLLVLFYQEIFLRVLGVFLIGFIFGAGYFHLSEIASNINNIQGLARQSVVLHGVVSDEISFNAKYQKIPLGFIKNGKRSFRGKVLIFAQKYPRYQIGDSLGVAGELNLPPRFKDFDYRSYLKKEKIFVLMVNPEKIGKIAPAKLKFPYREILQTKAVLSRIKSQFIQVLNHILVEPYGAFLAGLLIGAREEMPASLLDNFNQTGVTHIVAISGYNISIIIAALLFLGQRMHRRLLYLLLAIIIVSFVVLVGGQASVVRAGVMAGLLIVAFRLGRKADALILLIVAAFLMALFNPYVVRFDAGFQLSFLATLGLVIFADRFALLKSIQKLPKVLRESLIATLSATILVLPILAYDFGRISLISPVVNMLVLPAVPPAMAIGFCAGLVGLVWLGLGQIIGWAAFLFLYYIVGVIELFSRLPHASLKVAHFSWFWIVLYYLAVFWLWRFWQKKRKLDTE